MKKKKSKKLVNDMWESMLIPWFREPIPRIPTDKIIPKIEILSKHKIVKFNERKKK